MDEQVNFKVCRECGGLGGNNMRGDGDPCPRCGRRGEPAASPSPEGTRERGDRIGTHGVGCERWGYRHYECAVRRIEELEAAALTLPPVAGVDRDVVDLIERTARWMEATIPRISDQDLRDDAARDVDALRALVSPLEGKGSSCTETAARGTTASRPDSSCKPEGE